MNRKNVWTLSLMTAMLLPLGVGATDYRAEKPATWTAHTVDNAVKALYGDVKFIKSDKINLKMSSEFASGALVPVYIKTKINAKSVSLFQDVNPESAVAVWTVPEGGIVNYSVKMKLKEGSPRITVVVEGRDGKFYTTHKVVQVTGGGCEG